MSNLLSRLIKTTVLLLALSSAASKAAPDGYTLLIISVAHAVSPSLYKLNYDSIKSFTPIAMLATGPNVLVVNPELPVKSVKDLLALAKQKPDALNYASAGVGSFQQLGAELFKLQAGVPGYTAENWWGIVAPAGLPAPMLEKLFNAVQAALKAPALQAAFAREGAVSVEMSSAAFGQYMKTEMAKWGRVVKEGHITAQ